MGVAGEGLIGGRGAVGTLGLVGWEIRTGCGNVNVVEGDAGSAACVLFCKEMSAYGV